MLAIYETFGSCEVRFVRFCSRLEALFHDDNPWTLYAAISGPSEGQMLSRDQLFCI